MEKQQPREPCDENWVFDRSHQPGEYWWQLQCRSEEAVSLHSSVPICLPLAYLGSGPHPQADLNVLLGLKLVFPEGPNQSSEQEPCE